MKQAAMKQAASSCPLQFPAQQKGAVLIRLTPQLKEALLHAKAAGERVSMRFGAGSAPNVIRVGDQTFEFTANPEERCDLVRLPRSLPSAAAAVEVGPITQRLHVKRKLADEDRERVRSRCQEAAEKQHVRKAVLLDGSKRQQPGKAPRVVSAKQLAPQGVRRTAAAAGTAGRPPRSPAGAPLAVRPAPAAQPAPRPASRLASPTGGALLLEDELLGLQPPPVRGLTAQPAAPAAPPKPLPKGKAQVPVSATSTAKPPPPGKAVAAARQGDLRLCVIALLAERSYTRKGIAQAVAEVSALAGGKALRAAADKELDRVCKQVAELRAPGKWVLRPERRKDLEALLEAPLAPPAELPGDQPPPKAGRSKGAAEAVEGRPKQGPGAKRVAAEEAGGAPVPALPEKAHKRRKQAPGAAPASASAAALQPARVASREAEPQVLNRKQVQQAAPAVEPSPSTLLSGIHWAPPPTAFETQALYSWQKGAQEAAPPPGQLPSPASLQGSYGGIAGPASDSRRLGASNVSSTGVTASLSAGGVAGLRLSQTLATSLATSGEAMRGTASGAPGAAAAGSSPKPSAISSLRLQAHGGVAKSGSGGGAAWETRCGGRASRLGSGDSTGSLRRSLSGARFHEHYDESWFAEHVTRAPVLHYPIASEAEYRAAKEQHRLKREIYIRLHREIKAHEASVSGLLDAVRAAATEAEADKWRGQAAVLRRKRAPRLERWQTAFQVLHAELKALKKCTEDYKLSARDAPPQQPQPQQQHQHQQQNFVASVLAT